MNQRYEDIELLELLFTLWRNKLIIIVFVLIATLISSIYIVIYADSSDDEKIYESKLVYTVNLLPPKYYMHFNVSNWKTSGNYSMLISAYKKSFYSKEVFSKWKENNKESEILYEDLSLTRNVDGIILNKKEDSKLATFETFEDDDYIKIVVNKLPKLNDLFSYANHVSDTITQEHVLSSQIEKKLLLEKINRIENIFNKFYLENFDEITDINIRTLFLLGKFFVENASIGNNMSVLETYNEVEVIDSYINEVDNGGKAFSIERPTIPTLLNPEKFRISYLPILIFAALGAILGAFFVILRQAIMDRNERTKKS